MSAANFPSRLLARTGRGTLAARKPPQDPPSYSRQPAANAASVAEYIADMTGELARLAGAARLDMLTYLLNMARMEAEGHITPRP